MTGPVTGGPARSLTDEQELAIRSLERALAVCAKAGVAICGMDSGLIAYRADDLDAANKRLRSLYDAQDFLTNKAQTARSVESHGVYRDSGGW